MDIITHTLSAVSVGTLIATYKCNDWKQKLAVISASAIGGIIPDIDVITLWSGFDSSFGEFLSLPASGRDIYRDTLWYSHHGFMHSLCAIALFTGILALVLKYVCNSKSIKWIVLAFAFGYLAHLLGDLITPSGPWGGIRLFFPVSVYIGGTGTVWWGNNYDMFLCTFAMSTLGICLNFVCKGIGKKIIFPVFLVISMMIIGLVCTKTSNFNKGSYADNEIKSKKIQKELLPSPVYDIMITVDNKMPLLF